MCTPYFSLHYFDWQFTYSFCFSSFDEIAVKNKEGEKFVISMAYIDIATAYKGLRILENFWKTAVTDGADTTIQPSAVYGSRLQLFIYEKLRDVHVCIHYRPNGSFI